MQMDSPRYNRIKSFPCRNTHIVQVNGQKKMYCKKSKLIYLDKTDFK